MVPSASSLDGAPLTNNIFDAVPRALESMEEEPEDMVMTVESPPPASKPAPRSSSKYYFLIPCSVRNPDTPYR